MTEGPTESCHLHVGDVLLHCPECSILLEFRSALNKHMTYMASCPECDWKTEMSGVNYSKVGRPPRTFWFGG